MSTIKNILKTIKVTAATVIGECGSLRKMGEIFEVTEGWYERHKEHVVEYAHKIEDKTHEVVGKAEKIIDVATEAAQNIKKEAGKKEDKKTEPVV